MTGSVQIGTDATSVDLTGSTVGGVFITASAAGVLVLNKATTIDVNCSSYWFNCWCSYYH